MKSATDFEVKGHRTTKVYTFMEMKPGMNDRKMATLACYHVQRWCVKGVYGVSGFLGLEPSF